MYTLKSIARRSVTLSAAFAILASAVIPAVPAFAADGLNPLTERSLLLSSSAPGFQDSDGSGNSAGAPNAIGENYAPAGTGPNGKKSGQTFTVTTSSDGDVKGISFQYCTSAAGNCQAPGNNPGDNRTSTRVANTDPTAHAAGKSDFDVVLGTGWTQGSGAGQFQILTDKAVPGTFAPVSATDWAMTAVNKEDTAHSGALTGKRNYITLTSTTGEVIPNGTKVRVVFKASEDRYITNPGDEAFFVKLNTYDTATVGDFVPGSPANINGGVTVANVMTDSIHITTKVLETMAFSVGTKNRDTETHINDDQNPEDTGTTHGPCDPIQVVDNNRLNLGNPDAEYSLEVNKAWDVASYWRLSSNSSGGATVYYSGDTLRNTVGDSIQPIQRAANNTGEPVSTLSLPGSEQFGLAFVDASAETSASFKAQVLADNLRFRNPSVAPLNMVAAYQDGDGIIGTNTVTATARFAFDDRSMETPAVIAQNNDAVLSCATGKMRYVGNIGADTPAGVYTTKVNYLAAPQY